MMTTTAPNAGSAGGAVPHSQINQSSIPSHLQHPGLHPAAHPQTTLLLHPSSQHPLLVHPHHPHLLHAIEPNLHPSIGHQHLLPTSRGTALQPFYGHRGSVPGITRPTVHHPFPHRPPTPPQQPPTPPEARHRHREVDSPLGKRSLPQTPSPPLPTPPPSAHAPSERRRSEAESPSEASGGEESRLRERLGTGLVMEGRDLSSPAESDDEELSVGSESPPPPATTPLSPAPTASESASPTPPPQPPPASPPPQPPPHRSLKFSIDNILRPEFGKKGSAECDGKEGKEVGAEGKSPLDLSASVSPGAIPTAVVPQQHHQQPKQQQQSAAVSSSPTAKPTPPPSSASSSSSSGSSSSNSSQPLLWPAWVYCTRYSDRPSSGPRSRRVKRKDRNKGEGSSGEEKRPRTAFSAEQLSRLKQEFAESRYLTEKRRQALARDLRLNESQIKIWFQNKRAKIKKASGQRNPLALQLMAQGLYNHSTVAPSPPQAGSTATVTPPVGGPRSIESEGEDRCSRTDDEGSRTPGKRAGHPMSTPSPVADSPRIATAVEGM